MPTVSEHEQQIRVAKLADSLIITAKEFRNRAKDQPDQAATFETCAAHIEAQVDSYRSSLKDPYGPNWEKIAHALAAALDPSSKTKPETALKRYRKQAGMA